MNKTLQGRLQTVLQNAVASGLVPAHATIDHATEHPWPVVLLTALGAWFAAVPLLLAVGMLLGDVVRHGIGPYGVGVLVLVAAVVVLRAKDVPLFIEQLAVPALLVGGGTLAMGVYRDFHNANGHAIMLIVVLALALVISKSWLRVLAGAMASALLALALLPSWGWMRQQGSMLLVLHGLLALWLLALWLQSRVVQGTALVEALAAGWLLTTLVGLTWMAGTPFLMGGVVGSSTAGEVLGWIVGFQRHSWQAYSIQFVASLLVLTGAGVGALAWPTLRQFLVMAVALVLAVLTWFMPMLGAVLLALMVTATTKRWRQASACALAAGSMVSAFYYQLQWPLADKSLLLVVAGAVLGVLVWLSQRTPSPRLTPIFAPPGKTSEWKRTATRTRFCASSLTMLAGSLATLVVVNGAIWQKQDLIAHGQPIFMALQPVDPRSLMQGDYMRLRFAALDGHTLPLLADMGGRRVHLVVQRDARGVVTAQRLHTVGQPLAQSEMLLQLTPKNGAWVVVTDAWFFKEGERKRWQKAAFGEFRVLPDGRALLVGMADADLRPISIAPDAH
jgi:uncharacterized membrane-anchored protein